MHEVGECFERKNFQYKIVAKVKNEEFPGCYVYLVAMREFGENGIEYIVLSDGCFNGYKSSHWLVLTEDS